MQETQMKAFLREAREKITEQAALLQRLTAPPHAYAVVLSTSNRTVEVEQPWKVGQKVTLKEGRTGEIRDVNQQAGRLSADVWQLGVKNHWVNPSDVQAGKKQRRVGDTVKLKDGRAGEIQRIDPADGWFEVSLPFTSREILDFFELEPNETKVEVHTFAVVIFEGKLIEVEYPGEFITKSGDTVRLAAESMQIVDVVASFEPVGELAIVRRVLEGSQCEVDHGGEVRVVLTGRCETLEKGDRVILDSSFSIIMHNLGKQEERFVVDHDTNVTWDDIGGLEDAKQQMIEAIEMPYRFGELYRHYNKKPVKGVLLYGPPGCGKTMLGKATATALASLHGGDSSEGFFYVKGPEILDKFIGVAEATIRQLFERARQHKLEYGYPAVIFFDEADALMGKRGTGVSSDIRDTIVPMFLTEMDGLDESAAVVILATNRPDILDPAIVRDGRIDRKIKVTRPDQDNAAEIFQLYLQGIPLNNGYSVPELATSASNELFANGRVLYTVELRGGTSLDFNFSEVVNGGMIASIVDQATSKAMRRDMHVGTPSGLCQSDLIEAVEDVFRQNRDLDHQDELREFTRDFQKDVVSIHRSVNVTA